MKAVLLIYRYYRLKLNVNETKWMANSTGNLGGKRMKKKIVAILLTAVMAGGLIACGSGEKADTRCV